MEYHGKVMEFEVVGKVGTLSLESISLFALHYRSALINDHFSVKLQA